MSNLAGRVVVVTGCTGGAGRATVRRLVGAGATVIGSGTDAGRLAGVAESLGARRDRFRGDVVDLRDETAVRAWASELHDVHGGIDGVIHLVGGWRGSRTFGEASMIDADWLHEQIVCTLQLVSLAFHDDLAQSPYGRLAIVSATAVTHPMAGGAAYASSKAAAEAWTQALADSFAKNRQLPADGGTGAAAVIFVVSMLVDDAMRKASPGSAFAQATDVDSLADAVAGLWDGRAASDLNGARILLTP